MLAYAASYFLVFFILEEVFPKMADLMLTPKYLAELNQAAFDPRSRTRCGEIMLSPFYQRSRNPDDEPKIADQILLEMIANTPRRQTAAASTSDDATVLDCGSGMCGQLAHECRKYCRRCQSASTSIPDSTGEISEDPPADRPDPTML